MTKQRFYLLLLALFCMVNAKGQGTYPPQSLHRNDNRAYAFVNCHLVTKPGKVFDEGVLIIRNGLVENAGRNLKTPQDAEVIDLKGAWIYPGLIDPYAAYGLPTPPKSPGFWGKAPQYKSSRKGPYAWNMAVMPETRAANLVKHLPKTAANWRKIGFTTLNAVPADGIFRGTGTVIQLGNGTASQDILLADSYQCLSFRKGSSPQSYPTSLMGAIALIRQTLLDARWYQKARQVQATKPNTPIIETNLSLEAIDLEKPSFFEVRSYQDLLRAAQVAKEFRQEYIYMTANDSYQQLEAIKALKASLIVPLNFPQAYDLNSPAAARKIGLRKLMHWEQAPLNPFAISEQKIPFALSTHGLKSPQKEFWPALKKALAHGLKPEAALEALTLKPASMLGLGDRIGSLEPGKIANFLIASEPIFSQNKAVIFETWVGGKGHVNQSRPVAELNGAWELTYGDQAASLLISGKPASPQAKVVLTIDTLKAKIDLAGLDIAINFHETKSSQSGNIRLIGLVDGTQMTGRAVLANGMEVRWKAFRKGSFKSSIKTQASGPDLRNIPKPNFPFGPYGFTQIPGAKTIFIKNATLWTNSNQGTMQNGDVLIQNGKIIEVGKGLRPPGNAQVVDGSGMHLTPGIIDEHSHIAISGGVNEISHAVSAEVRIGDVLNGMDINIYRQLSGGVTTSQLLHGSANPIGGQAALIKLRWGSLPEAMKFEQAPDFIKFALGENVKQSNFGDKFKSRYPQSRLGVEQLIKDAFQAALDYRRAREERAKGFGAALPLRKDLQMETLLEIIDQKRFITCHSYVQSEITMLLRLAESFGFRVNTFTHILEGYKVADKLAAHGANGSTFSDWWAYKYEVIDAIPYNAALMHDQGINVCINSDDPEMARRLNQEAAKAVKYGGVSEEEALKMVTLNPAKALHIDHRVGSLEAGKDADVVLWSDHPLSVYARAEKTYIDGRLYFDRARDQELRKVIRQERIRLTKKMLSSGGKKQSPSSEKKTENHCDTYESDYNHE